MAYIAPLGWEHVNLIGHYQFSPQKDRSLDNLRPLRVHSPGEEFVAAD